MEPPDPFPNSEVKRRIADGSVGSPHVRVGHRQAPIPNPRHAYAGRGFVFALRKTPGALASRPVGRFDSAKRLTQANKKAPGG